MTHKLFITLFLLFSLVSAVLFAQKKTPPPGGVPHDFVLPPRNEFSLKNGLKVTMVEYGTLPKVTVRAVIRVGNLNESSEEVWIADLTNDLLKEGSTTRNAADIAEAAASMGGAISTSVGSEQSTVEGEVLSEFAPKLVELLADVIRNPAFPEAEFSRLKKDYLRNLSISKTRPQPLAAEKFAQVLYQDHPFGHYFPQEKLLSNYTLAQVKTFYKNNYGAKRTHLYVVGVFDKKKVEQAVRKNFEDWQSGPEIFLNIPQTISERKIYLIDRPGAPQSTILLGLPVVDPKNPDYMALSVTNTLLGGYFSSRITTNIREDKGYTYSPRSLISTHYREATWQQQADVTTAFTGASLKEIFYEIDRLRKEPPGGEELRGVKNYMSGIFVLRNSAPGGIINQLTFVNFHGLKDTYLTNYVKNIQAVTPQQVHNSAQKYLDPSKIILVVVGDAKKIRPQLKPYGEIIQE